MKALLLISGTGQKWTLTIPILIILKVPARAIRQDKINKEEVKFSLFSDDTILYIENPKYSTKKFLKLINNFSGVARYKTQHTKASCGLYANNNLSERQMQ